MRFLKYAIIPLVGLITACQSAPQQVHDAQSAQNADARLTLGAIEGQLHNGMSSASVIEVFGPPNIVTTDDQRREVWIYDRIATMHTRTSSGAWATILILGMGDNTKVSSTSQRTLTLIIKYDDQKKVRDFSYRYSNF